MRGFELVSQPHIKYGMKVQAHGVEQVIYPEERLPVRADKRSAGYDFYTPVDVTVLPNSTVTVWTNVKAHMQPDEVLLLFVRSSIGIRDGVTLANGTGVIDASYYNNEENDGNIGICLKNNTGITKIYKAGERIAQGIFTKFLVADDEQEVLQEERKGYSGSSGK